MAGLLSGFSSGCGCLPLFLTPNPQCTAPTSRYLIGTAGGLNHACLQVDRSGLGSIISFALRSSSQQFRPGRRRCGANKQMQFVNEWATYVSYICTVATVLVLLLSSIYRNTPIIWLMDHMNDEDATAVMCSEKHQQTLL